MLERCYRAHFAEVSRATGAFLRGADKENVVHEVFARLIADERIRRSFTGGSMAAWLTTSARNLALDTLKRQGREVPLEAVGDARGAELEEQLLARDTLRRVREKVPAKWLPVFEACFVERLDQRAAAHKLSMSRTTLAYQWLRVKWLLEKFVLSGGDS